MENILEVVNLKKSYGDIKAVDDISFQVKEGSFFSFLGHNGAGKSTTINIISTLLKKDSGDIYVKGIKVGENDAEIRNNIGVVFQESVLDDLLTVEENFILRGSFYNFTRDETIKSIDDIDEILSVKELLNQHYGKLSGGQKRRVDVAYALINPPKLLILDEPTTGLDPKARKDVWKSIKKLQIERNITIFLTTHYMEETLESNKVIIIDNGKIVADGTPEELRMKYSKDTLILVPKNMEDLQKELTELRINYRTDRDRLVVIVKDSQEALTILNKIKNYKKFEVIGGSMDDVFVRITDVGEGY